MKYRIDKAELVSYCDSSFNLHSYLKIPYEAEKVNGDIHIDGNLCVYVNKDNEESQYAQGTFSSELTKRFDSIALALGLRPEDIQSAIIGYEQIDSRIFEAAMEIESEKKTEKKSEKERA